MPEDDLNVSDAAALIAKLSGRPMSIRGVQKAIERRILAAEERTDLPGPYPRVYFIARAEAERYAAWRKTQPRRGPKSAKEQQAEKVKAIRKTERPDSDPWDYRRKGK